MAKLIGVDLGTSNTFMYMKSQGIKLRSPSVVAIDKHTRELVTIGPEAKKIGRASCRERVSPRV